MRTGRPKAMFTISNEERSWLLAITQSRSLPAALTLAKIVPASEREPSNAAVVRRLGVGAYGHVQEGGRHMIVSGGLGTSIIPARLGVPPEIVRIELGV